jgi:hypothetical protein
VNWGKFALGGLIASVICFVTDGLMHEKLLHTDWDAVFTGLKATPPPHSNSAFAYFGVLEIGRGFGTLFLYMMMRARMGAGPKTAAWAGVAAWYAFSLTGPAQYVPMGFLTCGLWLKASGFQLLTSILAGVVGAAPYAEKR